MRPKPQNPKEIIQGNSGGEEPENESDNSSSSGEEESDDDDVDEDDENYDLAEEAAAHEARMEVLREENRRLVAISEERDRQLMNEIQLRDEVQRRIRDLEQNIDDLKRRRDGRE